MNKRAHTDGNMMIDALVGVDPGLAMDLNPAYMAENHPALAAYYNPELMADLFPEFMVKHNPEKMKDLYPNYRHS